MKFLKNKKAFEPITSIIILIIAFGLGIGATIGFSTLYKHYSTPKIDGIKLPGNATPQSKICGIEGGCGDMGINQGDVETPSIFGRTCEDLNKRGFDTYFKSVSGDCVSCKQYFQDGKLPEKIISTAYPSLIDCQTMVCDNSNTLVTKSKEDCDKAKNYKCVDVISREKYCGSNPTEEKCPDLKVGGVLPFPNLWCKLKEWLKELFLPFKIGISVLATVLAWLFSFLTLKNIDFKTNKKTRNIISWIISVILGLIVGTLVWFYWYIGLLLLTTLFILKMFIWK